MRRSTFYWLAVIGVTAGLARAEQPSELTTQLATWEATRERVTRLMIAPEPACLAAADEVLRALRTESSVTAAGVHPVRPFNDLPAETAYADRMLDILRPQIETSAAEQERLRRHADGLKAVAGNDAARTARIDHWIELVEQTHALTRRAAALYAERTAPGWYDRACLVAKFDLPIANLRQQAARREIDDPSPGAAPDAPTAAGLAAYEAGKATYTAMMRFHALMTRESPLVAPTPSVDRPITRTPWDIPRLSAPPLVRWLDQTNTVRQLLYRGEPYQGKPTDVFAYYASPGTLAGDSSRDKDLPALVLVHGGGDRATRDWVVYWAQHGYAVIAMDLAGQGPTLDGAYDKLFKPERLLRGGPGQDGKRKILDIDLPLTDQWPYHAVANVILAHSLVRSFPEVNAERTAVAGISWGGYTTCLVAGVDPRFKAAVPFYGCGFLAENSVWKDMGLFDELGEVRARRWTELWDPARYAGQIRCPVFAVTGTRDFAYPLESFARTYTLTKGPVQFRITPEMGHGGQFLTSTPEVTVFLDQVLRGGGPLPTVRIPQLGAESVTATVAASGPVTAQFHYTTAHGPNKTREWKTVAATVTGDTVSAARPRPRFVIGYFTIKDARVYTVSSAPLLPVIE